MTEMSSLLKMLDVLLRNGHGPEEKKNIPQNGFDITMTSDMESKADEMCNLSEGVPETMGISPDQ
ncbi:MAG: hypothetical protein IJ682_04760 [Lachnospiraceae bacterium]|nr:hypothetical protein [Lachnospiraceae bacterium]